MEDDETIVVELALQARDMATNILSGITHALGGVEKAALSAKSALGSVGLGATGLVAAGALAFAVKEAEHYQTTMTKLGNNAVLTKKQIADMGQTIQAVATGTTSSANDMAAAMAPVAGVIERVTGKTLDAADATKMLTAAQDLHEATGANLTSSLKNITDLLLVYKLKSSDAARVSTDLFDAQAQLGMSADRLGTMIQRLQPRLAGSGLSLEHFLGIVREVSGPGGIGTGPRALMQVGTILQGLMTPSKGAATALDALGISVKNSKGNFIGYPELLGKLHDAYERLPAVVAKGSTEISRQTLLQTMFGKQANIGKILIEGGNKAIVDNTVALAKNGSAAEAARKQHETLGGQMETITADIKTAATAIGGPLVNALTAVLLPITGVVDAITKFAVKNPGLIAGILGITAAIGGMAAITAIIGPLIGAAFGPLLGAIGGLGAAVGAVSAPVLLLGAAIAALILIVVKVPGVLKPILDAFNLIRAAVTRIVGPVMDFVGAIIALVTGSGSLSKVGSSFTVMIGQIGSSVGRLIPMLLADLGKAAKAFIDWVQPMIPKVLAAIGRLGIQIGGWIRDQAPKWLNMLLSWIHAFTDWVTKVLPPLLGQLLHVASGIISWIGSQVGPLANALLGWIDGFVAWVGPMIGQLLGALGDALPKVLGALGDMLMQVINFIAATAPKIAKAVLDLAIALTSWVVKHIPDLLAGLEKFGKALIGWIVGAIPTVVKNVAEMATRIIGALASEIINSIGVVWDAIKQIPMVGDFIKVVSNAIEKAVDLGKKVIGAIVKGIGAVMTDMWDAIHKIPIIGGIADLVADVVTNATNLGKGIIGGLIDGITSMAQQLADTIHSLPLIGNLMDIGGSLIGAATTLGGQIVAGVVAGTQAQPTTPQAAAAVASATTTAAAYGPAAPGTTSSYVAPADAYAASRGLGIARKIPKPVVVKPTATTTPTTPLNISTPDGGKGAANAAKGVQAAQSAAEKHQAALNAAAEAALGQANALNAQHRQQVIQAAQLQGVNTALLAATSRVAAAHDAEALAALRMTDAKKMLALAEHAKYANAAAKTAAVDHAELAYQKALDADTLAKGSITTAELAYAQTVKSMQGAEAGASDKVIKAQTALTNAQNALAAAQAAEAAAKTTASYNAAKQRAALAEQRVEAATAALTAAHDALTTVQQSLADAGVNQAASSNAVTDANTALAISTLKAKLATDQAAEVTAENAVKAARTVQDSTAANAALKVAMDNLAADQNALDAATKGATAAQSAAAGAPAGAISIAMGGSATLMPNFDTTVPVAATGIPNSTTTAAGTPAITTVTQVIDAGTLAWQGNVLAALTAGNASLSGILMALGGKVAPSTLPGTSTVSPTTVSAGQPSWKVSIYLDGRVLSGAISKILFDEERQYAGPVSNNGTNGWA